MIDENNKIRVCEIERETAALLHNLSHVVETIETYGLVTNIERVGRLCLVIGSNLFEIRKEAERLRAELLELSAKAADLLEGI